MASLVRQPEDLLITARILLLRPSTTPLEISPLARSQFRIRGAGAHHPGHLLPRFQTAARGPEVEKGSRPDHRFVLPEVGEGLL
jgi:hypothetical protein